MTKCIICDTTFLPAGSGGPAEPCDCGMNLLLCHLRDGEYHLDQLRRDWRERKAIEANPCQCGHAVMQSVRTAPLMGRDECDCCRVLSEVYAIFATCRECDRTVCEACSVGDWDDDERGTHGICHGCGSETADPDTSETLLPFAKGN